MTYISNAFSLGMLPQGASVQIKELDSRPVLTDAVSIVGHQDTAAILGLPFNRQSVSLNLGDTLFVAQYNGPRLPEGTTELPDGASFRWFVVTI